MVTTSTSLILRPTTSRSRSRFSVSTSGSSGIDEPVPRLAGGGRLGGLLGTPLAAPVRLSGDEDRRHEPLGVVGALVDDVVARKIVECAGGQLLEPGLVVVAAGAGGGLGDAFVQQLEDQLLSRPVTGVEVHRADDGFHGVGEDRRLLPPARLL